LKRGADPNIENDIGFSPFNQACFYGQINLIKLMLDYGARTEMDINGNYTFTGRFQNGQENIVKDFFQKYNIKRRNIKPARPKV
jgi:ankyrin repeat protein